MLDLIDTTTEITAPPITSGTSDAPIPHIVPLTEEQARADYAEMTRTGATPPIRTIAQSWGWSKSAAGRLVGKIKAEEQTAAIARSAEINRQREEQRSADERKREEELDARDKTFDSSNPNLLVPEQPTTVVHWNAYDQIVILQRSETQNDYGDYDDPFVVISRVHLPKLIARLQELARGTPS